MGWVFQSAYESFHENREIWDGLNKTHGNHILLDSMFVEPLIRHFGSRDTLLALSNDPKNPGMVLMDRGKKGFWQTFQPPQEPLGLILLGSRDGVTEQMHELIRSLPGHALGFSALQQDPDYTVFKDLNLCKKVEILEYIKTARLTCTGTFEDYWKKRGKDLVDNIARRRRRLERQGVQFELVIDYDENQMIECIQEYGKLEGFGWKAARGSAVTDDNRQGIFYREILEHFCRQGEGVFYRLLFDKKTVASQFGLKRGGTLVLLKMAYNEDMREHSPGFLLQERIFHSLFSKKEINTVEFYGRVRDGWTTKWTDEIRTMYHVNFYRWGWIAGTRRFLKSSSWPWRSAGK